MKTYEDKIAALSPEDREDVLNRGHSLLLEEMTLRELRQALNITQDEIADLLETAQNNISRIERQSDMKISTVQGIVDALGGSLKLVATFPDREDVQVSMAKVS